MSVSRDARATVSVVVIVRNGAAYLADALHALRDPGCLPDEILVVDGGSTDDTVAIASAVPGVTVLAQRSQGIAGAYNEAIAAARGELVAFCSHDDRWLPGKLRAQVDYLAAHPEAGYCVTHVQHVLADGATPPPGFRRELLDGPVPGFIMECLVSRRTTLAAVGPFDPAFHVSEDTDWFARARDAKVPHGVLPDAYVHKRIHGTNASLTDPAVNAHLLRALRRSLERKREAPAIDVIVPCYDAARYLDEALASIAAQGVPGVGIVVVDDGSTDGSGDVARRHGPAVRVLRQENQGAAVARNTGLAATRAPLVAFLDADDVWLPNALALRVAALADDPGAGYAAGLVEQFASPDLPAAGRATLAIPTEPMRARVAGSIVVRRAVIDRIGGFDPRWRMGEAIDWVARADAAGIRCAQLDAVVLRRRVHATNSVHKTSALHADYLGVLRAAIARRRAQPPA